MAHKGTVCRSCNARILWGQLIDASGERQRKPDGKFKAIPVDFEPSPAGNVVLFDRHGDETTRGIVARVLRRGESPPPGAKLRTPHFATCPNADKHRSKR